MRFAPAHRIPNPSAWIFVHRIISHHIVVAVCCLARTVSNVAAEVHTYVTELLKELGEDEDKITKFQTGGPDGDLGSNEILISKDLILDRLGNNGNNTWNT